jgi:protein-tyrosine phosphatase
MTNIHMDIYRMYYRVHTQLRNIMFRRVPLPDFIPGMLFLTAMPGRFEPLAEWRGRMIRLNISHIVCLNPLNEIENISPDYFRIVISKDHPWHLHHFPIPDFGVPDDSSEFLILAKKMSTYLNSGEKILIHCAAGIGRTGTFSMVLLMAAGLSREEAAKAVRMAYAQPEGLGQRHLIDWCQDKLQ